ncbi:MAG: undecaprenyl-diphosphate phosphatase, partial [candidate division WOR-3 bacterium]
MSLIEAAVLGLLQGATEFLPVSSSGHLALLQHIWHLPEAQRLPLTTMLHLGTAAAVLVFFARRLGRIGADCIARSPDRRRAAWRLIGFIAVASLPAAVVGLVFEEQIKTAFSAPPLVALMLLISGMGLFGTRLAQRQQPSLGWSRVMLIGVAQAVAVLPGISRSGATICVGIYSGLDPEQAFEFS